MQVVHYRLDQQTKPAFRPATYTLKLHSSQNRVKDASNYRIMEISPCENDLIKTSAHIVKRRFDEVK